MRNSQFSARFLVSSYCFLLCDLGLHLDLDRLSLRDEQSAHCSPENMMCPTHIGFSILTDNNYINSEELE